VKETITESLEIPLNEYSYDDLLLKCPTWDSIGLLSIIANFKDRFNITIEGKSLIKLKTFSDLYSYILTLGI
jgi:acyl carrier protein